MNILSEEEKEGRANPVELLKGINVKHIMYIVTDVWNQILEQTEQFVEEVKAAATDCLPELLRNDKRIL